jgi:carotene biosynthesis associated membrane protein
VNPGAAALPTRAAVRAAAQLVVLQIAYAFVSDDAAGWTTAVVVLAFLLASLLAASARSGPAYALAIAAAGFAVGAVAEAVGVVTGFPFGDYAYTDRLGPSVLDVPLVVPLAWAMMAYPAWRVAETLATGRATRVLVAALALVAWDVALDPQMVGFGFWVWPDGGAYEGIPLGNYAGWLLVGLLLYALWAVVEPRRAPRRIGPVEDGLGVLLYAWTWIGETVAHLVFWGRPLVALASFVAMGALAVPALVRWARAHGLGFRQAAGVLRAAW